MDINDLFITDADDDDDDYIESEEDIIKSLIQQQSMPKVIFECAISSELKDATELGKELILNEITNNKIISLEQIILFNRDSDNCLYVYDKYTRERGIEVNINDLSFIKQCAGLVVLDTYGTGWDFKQILFLEVNCLIFYAIAKNPSLCPSNISEEALTFNASIAHFIVLHELGHVFYHENVFEPNRIVPSQLEDNSIQAHSSECLDEYFASRFACSNLEKEQEEYHFYNPIHLTRSILLRLKEQYSSNCDMLLFPNRLLNYIACCHHYNIDIDWETIFSIKNIELKHKNELEKISNKCYKLYNLYQDKPKEFNKIISYELKFLGRWHIVYVRKDDDEHYNNEANIHLSKFPFLKKRYF